MSLSDAAEIINQTSKSVVVMAGAGISVSSGIPDFRTPGTGLYDNLSEYGLPYPEAIFDLDFYRSNPRPFQRLCKELWPGNFSPTPTHCFLKVLHDKGKLRRCFTQNIDSLESAAGLPTDLIVAAHGNFDAAHVVGSMGAPVPIEEVREAAFGGEAEWQALFAKYGGPVKPSIVFFGEQLPKTFFEKAASDLPACDLLLVLGTSLVVQPFASLVGETRPGTPRLLINRDRVGDSSPFNPRGFEFDRPDSSDGLFLGDCDDAVHELAELLGWQGELKAAIQAARSATSH